MNLEFYRRLVMFKAKLTNNPPWEGVTWVLDLLPHWPKEAIQSINNYILAHNQLLSDISAEGMYDAIEIIRAKYIGLPTNEYDAVRLLMELHWRDFERIVERLYSRMGFNTKLTPGQKDGGLDILVWKVIPGKAEHLAIECKQRTEDAIGIEIVQRLLGVVSGMKINRGVLVTTNRFTEPAREYADENPRIELINGLQLVELLNKHLGPRWTINIERIILESKKEHPD